jgi:hypothetical protein
LESLGRCWPASDPELEEKLIKGDPKSMEEVGLEKPQNKTDAKERKDHGTQGRDRNLVSICQVLVE